MGRGRNTSLSRFPVISGGAILPPQWPDRPAIWGMSVERLSNEEQRQLTSLILSRFRYGDLAFYQYELGMLTEDRLESAIRPVTGGLCNWLYRDVWSRMRPNFVSGYREYIDSRVVQC